MTAKHITRPTVTRVDFPTQEQMNTQRIIFLEGEIVKLKRQMSDKVSRLQKKIIDVEVKISKKRATPKSKTRSKISLWNKLKNLIKGKIYADR